jgi:hypothetical protein
MTVILTTKDLNAEGKAIMRASAGRDALTLGPEHFYNGTTIFPVAHTVAFAADGLVHILKNRGGAKQMASVPQFLHALEDTVLY